MNLQEKQTRRDEVYLELRKSMRKLTLICDLKCNLEASCCALRNEYERLDREMALEDGRLSTYSCFGNKQEKITKTERKIDPFHHLTQNEKLLLFNSLQEVNEGSLQ